MGFTLSFCLNTVEKQLSMIYSIILGPPDVLVYTWTRVHIVVWGHIYTFPPPILMEMGEGFNIQDVQIQWESVVGAPLEIYSVSVLRTCSEKRKIEIHSVNYLSIDHPFTYCVSLFQPQWQIPEKWGKVLIISWFEGFRVRCINCFGCVWLRHYLMHTSRHVWREKLLMRACGSAREVVGILID